MVIKQGAMTLTFCWDADWHRTETAFREAEGRQKHPSYHEVAARSRGLTGKQSWKNWNKEGSGKRTEALKRKNFPRRSKSPLSRGLFEPRALEPTEEESPSK